MPGEMNHVFEKYKQCTGKQCHLPIMFGSTPMLQ